MTKDAEGTVKVYVDGVLKNSNTDARDVDLLLIFKPVKRMRAGGAF